MINVFLEDKETVIDWKAIAKLLGIYNTCIITETVLLTIFYKHRVLWTFLLGLLGTSEKNLITELR